MPSYACLSLERKADIWSGLPELLSIIVWFGEVWEGGSGEYERLGIVQRNQKYALEVGIDWDRRNL